MRVPKKWWENNRGYGIPCIFLLFRWQENRQIKNTLGRASVIFALLTCKEDEFVGVFFPSFSNNRMWNYFFF